VQGDTFGGLEYHWIRFVCVYRQVGNNLRYKAAASHKWNVPEETIIESYPILGGYSEKRDFPEDYAGYRFEPGPNIIDAEPFSTESIEVLTTRLFLSFGLFDLVSMSTEEWSVEQPGKLLGTVTVFYRLDGDENCGSNGESTVQSKLTAFDRGVSS
jgi:hypothetical protein